MIKESTEIDLRRECGEVAFSLEVVGELGDWSDVNAVMNESCEVMEELVIIDSLVSCPGTARGLDRFGGEVSSKVIAGFEEMTNGVEPVVVLDMFVLTSVGA